MTGSIKLIGRAAPRAAAALALLVASACGRPFYNLGKTIEGVSPDSVAMELFLIGDAGLPAPGGEPVLKALTSQASWDPERTFVVYLGDNIYPTGLPDSAGRTREEAERILDEQIEAVRDAGTRGILVPGNHDWEAGAAGGWWAIARQEAYVREHGKGDVWVLPRGGCPGPEVLDFGEAVRLVALDTQWWLHEWRKPGADRCRPGTEAGVVDSIRTALRTAGPRQVVVVAHHPLASGGQHGGYFDWPSYLFPFHPWARQAGFFAEQDITGVTYRRLIGALTGAFRDNPPLVYAAGHEHNLQVFRRDPARYLVVSGAGIYGHTTPVRAITGVRYARRASGYVRLAFLRDGRVRLAVVVVDAEGKPTEDFSTWLETVLPGRTPAPGAAPAPAAPDSAGTSSAGPGRQR